MKTSCVINEQRAPTCLWPPTDVTSQKLNTLTTLILLSEFFSISNHQWWPPVSPVGGRARAFIITSP